MVNRMMNVAETSMAVPKMPSSVMYMWPTSRSTSYPRCVEGREGQVEPLDPVAEPLRRGEEEEAEEEHERDVDRPEDLCRDHRLRGVEVEQRHPHRDGGQDGVGPALEVAGRALLLLDELLGLLPGPLVDDGERLAQRLARGHERRRRASGDERWRQARNQSIQWSAAGSRFARITSRSPWSPSSRKDRSLPRSSNRCGVPAATRKTISFISRSISWRSPGPDRPRYSRTAALGLETEVRAMSRSGSTTNSSVTGRSYIECCEVTENGSPSRSAIVVF